MSADKKFKVGLVGAGQISRFHLEALRRVSNAQILGIADVDGERARRVAGEWKISAFGSLDAMLSEGVEVIHVLTPPATHAETALVALAAGCHVYVEKPLATSVADCERIAAAARERGLSVCVGHSLLRDALVVRALGMVRAGAIGEPLTADYFRCQPAPPYAGGPLPEYYRHGGHPFRDLGIHALYLMEAFLGIIQDANALFDSTGREPHLFADEWRVLLRCARGTGQIQMSWNVRPQQNLLVVQGTRGVMRVDLFGMSVSVKRAGRLPEHASRVWNALSESRQVTTQAVANAFGFFTGRVRRFHGLQSLVADFYRSLADGQPAPVTPEAAVNVVDWTERIARRADVAKQAHLRKYVRPLTAKVLVTGAAGFIGRHLVERLLNEDQRVRVLVRREPPSDWMVDDRIELVLGDLGDPDVVDRAVEGIETIYHVGAAMRGAAHDFERGTVAGTRNVVDSALRHGVGKFIYISSLSVLHSLAEQSRRPITESWPIEPFPDRRGQYTRTKCAAEKYVLDAVRERGFRAVILRPGEVVGPGAPLITSGIAQRKGNRLIVLGDGQLRLPMVYVDDLIDAILLATARDCWDGSVLHIVDATSPTQNEIIASYLAANDRRLTVLRLPRLLVYGLAAASQSVFALLRRNSPITVYRVRSAMAERAFDGSSAAKHLRWIPRVGVNVGLRHSLELELLNPAKPQGVDDVTPRIGGVAAEDDTFHADALHVTGSL